MAHVKVEGGIITHLRRNKNLQRKYEAGSNSMFGCGSSVCIKPCTTLDYPYVEASVEVVQQRVKEKSQVEEEQDFVFFVTSVMNSLLSCAMVLQ